jgi:hypothetical protein
MDTFIHDARVQISFKDTFPFVGEQREIIKADQSEWLIEVLYIGSYDWMMENGKVVGVQADMKYRLIEEVRPSSKGKLRLL